MSLDRLRQKLLADAHAEAERMRQTAQAEADALLEAASAEVREKMEHERRARIAACQQACRQRIARARIEARNDLLRTRHEVMESVYCEAASVLARLDDATYRTWLERRLADVRTSADESIVFAEVDRSRLDRQWLAELARKLPPAPETSTNGLFHFDEEVDGGFVLRHDRYEIDVTLGTLLRQLHESMDAELTTILFEPDDETVLPQ
jgi:V/A-type H+/Na+-transporting ATPase subunit E